MGIIINQDRLQAHLFTNSTSYVIDTFMGELVHSYWGKRIEIPEITPLVPIETMVSFYPNPDQEGQIYSLDLLPREYPDFGRSDYRNPSVSLKLKDGTKISKFLVQNFSVSEGKPDIEGLPATYAEPGDNVKTLLITLKDEKSGVVIELYYAVYEDFDAITRHVRYINNGVAEVVIDCASSANVDFYNDNDFDLIHFNGSWGREREMSRLPVGKSTHIVESKRGSSSHMQNPLVMLARPSADDIQGEVYGMNLVYSGSFKSVIEVNSYDATRLAMGINDHDFEWCLEPEAAFSTPEVVMAYSDEGFNGMSHIYHELYRKRLCKGPHRDKERPVLINNWEATYFQFTQEKLEAIAENASDLGMELFVLDDGWFGVRNSDESGLGDWFVNMEKLPNGLTGIADFVTERTMQFGLWFEPEMVSEDSDLYRAHPDWCLHTPGHTRTRGRHQLVLDFSRRDVQDHIIEVVSDILRNHPITYVKWDMNRNMTEVNSALLPPKQQRETTHRYILGLYRVMDTITREFDEILFESCSGGGGRFDPGMLYYMPQTWTSDDTDAFERQFIQYGTSFAYPQITMGAHVSVSPNHQTGRVSSLQTRAHVSMMANLGYELDLSALTEEEKEQVAHQISYYKSIRKDIQFGRLYRLLSPYGKTGTCFLIESEDQNRYYLFYFRGLNKLNTCKFRLPLRYISDGDYKAEIIRFSDESTVLRDPNGHEIKDAMDADILMSGSYLNRFGYTFGYQRYDFDSTMVVFTKQ